MGEAVEAQKDVHSSFKEFNLLLEREAARYQEKCYKGLEVQISTEGQRRLFPSRGHRNHRRGSDSQAEATKGTETVPGKGLGGRVWR